MPSDLIQTVTPVPIQEAGITKSRIQPRKNSGRVALSIA